MLPKYQSNFDSLDPACAGLLSTALLRRYPDFGAVDPSRLFLRCEEMSIDHADVVMSLANDPSALAVRTLEALVGKPIDKGWPCLSGKAPVAVDADGTPAPVRVVKERMQRAPRGSVTDPRIITHVAPNPKKPGSASFDRFALYRVGMTVNEAIAAGVKREDVAWDSETKRGFIKFGEGK